jgi:hypothetical protein
MLGIRTVLFSRARHSSPQISSLSLITPAPGKELYSMALPLVFVDSIERQQIAIEPGAPDDMKQELKKRCSCVLQIFSSPLCAS